MAKYTVGGRATDTDDRTMPAPARNIETVLDIALDELRNALDALDISSTATARDTRFDADGVHRNHFIFDGDLADVRKLTYALRASM